MPEKTYNKTFTQTEMTFHLNWIGGNKRLNQRQRDYLKELHHNTAALWRCWEEERAGRLAAEQRVEELIAGIRESNAALGILTGDLVEEQVKEVA